MTVHADIGRVGQRPGLRHVQPLRDAQHVAGIDIEHVLHRVLDAFSAPDLLEDVKVRREIRFSIVDDHFQGLDEHPICARLIASPRRSPGNTARRTACEPHAKPPSSCLRPRPMRVQGAVILLSRSVANFAGRGGCRAGGDAPVPPTCPAVAESPYSVRGNTAGAARDEIPGAQDSAATGLRAHRPPANAGSWRG